MKLSSGAAILILVLALAAVPAGGQSSDYEPSRGYELVGEGDEILLSVLEHHSNIVPWQLLASRVGATLRYIELDEQGRLVLDDLPGLITRKTKIVAISHVSNALGTINPVSRIAEAAHAHGALVVVDGAQGAVHLPVDVQALGVDV